MKYFSKVRGWFILGTLLLACGLSDLASGEDLPFTRVMNIGDALEAPINKPWSLTLDNRYFHIIKRAGFDAVRIPVRFSDYTQGAPLYILDKNFMNKIDGHVRYALSLGLVVILDLHHFDELMKSPLERKKQFLSIWWQLSEHYEDFSEKLIFEILNEPTGELQGDLWNDYLLEAVFTIRVKSPNRYLIIGPDFMNQVKGLSRLKIPQTSRLILTFHYYDPIEFTHQGLAFAGLQDKTGRAWEHGKAEKLQIQQDFQIVRDFASAHNLPVFLGEFGVNTHVDDMQRASWIAAVRREAEALGFAWGYWEFASSFSAYDLKKDAWRQHILSAFFENRAR
jgi:endoglucanase